MSQDGLRIVVPSGKENKVKQPQIQVSATTVAVTVMHPVIIIHLAQDHPQPLALQPLKESHKSRLLPQQMQKVVHTNLQQVHRPVLTTLHLYCHHPSTLIPRQLFSITLCPLEVWSIVRPHPLCLLVAWYRPDMTPVT